MPLDLSDEALGLPSAQTGALDLSDEALGLPAAEPATQKATDYQELTKESRAQFIKPGSALSGTAIEAGLAVLEQPAAGIYGLLSQSYSGLKGLYKGAIGTAAGLPFGEVFREEFDKAAENAAQAYVPLTPGGEMLTHKISELITKGLQNAGGFVFEKGLPLPGPGTLLQEAGAIKGPFAEEPAAAAAFETMATAALLGAPVGGRGKGVKPTPRPAPAVSPLAAWDDFAARYPDTAKAIDASSLGAVRFRREDTSVMDAVQRQMNTELGLTHGQEVIPFRLKAGMIFDRIAPDLPMGEKMRAVQSLEAKIDLLDRARIDLSSKRGLPAPAVHPFDQAITVTSEGMAITAEQARMLNREFLSKSPSERADALAVSLMGQLRVQAENVLKQPEGSGTRSMEMSALKRMWRQSFPDEYLGGRDAALEKFINFDGRLTYPQVLEALGPAKRAEARAWRKSEAGAIDIEGMDYLLNSFKDLPNQPILKRATIVGQLNRQGVPQAEKDAVLRALRDRDSITQAELVGNVAADILPLKQATIKQSPAIPENRQIWFVGLDRVGAVGAEKTIRVWQMPLKTELYNHFEVPDYFAHTRGFERAGVRHVAEIQSDLMQGALRDERVIAPDRLSPLGDLEKLATLNKRWYERILMEENRQASRDGVRTMRVATADTVAKANMWIRGFKEGEHGIRPSKLGAYTQPATAVRVRGGEVSEIFVGSGRGGRWVSAGAARSLLSRAERAWEGWDEMVLSIPKETLPPNLQGIHSFYKNEVASFTRARFGAREVFDEFNNSWMEWPVRADDATKKIPAFGGRQRGAIDIPEFEDVVRASERGKDAAAQAGARGWTTPAGAGDELYNKTKAAFEKSRAAEVEQRKVTIGSLAKQVRQRTIAHDYDLRAELDRAGEYGQRAVDRIALQNGATMAAKTRMDAINENIYNQLDTTTKGQVDELMRLRRIIEIDSYKGVGKHKHPEGITGPQAEAVAIRMKQELGDEQFTRVYSATNQVMREYKDILSRRYSAGLLSDESYMKLLHFDYSPTEFIDLIDPLQTYNIHGHKVTVRTSGVPFLERGKRGNVVMDSQLLLAEALVRSENLMFKNETLKSLHTLAMEVPENKVVRPMPKGSVGKEGTPEAYVKHTPSGWTSLGVRQEGKQDFILMREDLAEQFVHRPQVMPEFVATMFRIGSGTAAIKATSTTYNPGFVVAGLPMDILHTWLATSRDYSSHLPAFAGQMALDLAATAKDAWTRGPKYQQALQEGLGSAFMTHEGRGFTGLTERSVSVAERQMMPKFDKIKTALSYVNEAADIWVRMAHRERLLKQGVDSWEATGRARNRLDYSAGGEFTRAVDTVLPYTNVAVQAISKVVQAGVKDKADLGIKLAWGAGAITSSVLANMIASPETWQQIPTSDKIRSLPITFGDQFYIVDPDGNKRYLYMPGVRLDAVVAPVAATIIAGLEEAEYGRMPDQVLSKSFANLNPVLEFQAPPVIEAVKTYLSNFDAFTGRPITPHAGQVLPQNEGLTYGRGEPPSALSRAVGAGLGMSPPRLDAAARKVINPNNTYLAMAGWGYRMVFEGTDPRIMSESTAEALLKNQAIRPLVKLTNPSTQYLQQIDEKRMEEGSRRKQMTDSVDNLLFQVRKGQANVSDVQTYIRNQPGEDREWLGRYAITTHKVKEVMQRFGASEGIPNESWWRSVSALEPRPRAQEFYSQWLSAAPEDRSRMERIAVGLHNAGAGFYSDSFRRELARERELLGVEQR